mgnify:CR=1 FL=1
MTDASLMELIKNLTQFGVAGLMGVLWVIERWLSRRRETQLDEAHYALARRHDEVESLVRLVDRNARAFDRFAQTQQELRQLLESLHAELQRRQAA